MPTSSRLPVSFVRLLQGPAGGVGFTAFVAVIFLAIAPPAGAQSPWWHLESASSPVNLHEGVTKDEVQEITVSATGGFYELSSGEGSEGFEPDWTAQEVQEHLEVEQLYGTGNVKVTGGPGDENGSKPYIVTFEGAFADEHVPLEVIHSHNHLTGGSHRSDGNRA